MLNKHSCQRILVAGYSFIVRRGLASIVCGLAPDAAIVEVSSFDEARKRLGCEDFFAAIFDIEPEDTFGPRDIQKIRANRPHLVLGVLSRNDNASIILGHLAAGVNGYILGSSSPAEIECAVGAILRGAIYVPPSLVRSKASQFADNFDGPPLYRKPKGLTGRQTDVLRLLLNGYSNKEIARELALSPHTVKIHVGAVLRYFAVERRTDLAAAASREHSHGVQGHDAFAHPEVLPCASIIA
jgi:DNA-binding NarL/FixJ family response regulator